MATLTHFQAVLCCDALPLQDKPASGLRVHSVFQHACNLQTPEGEMWVIQAQGMPLAPMGMVINSRDLRPYLTPGDTLHWHAHRFHSEKINIDTSQAACCPTRLIPFTSADNLLRLAESIARFFAGQPAKGFRLALSTDAKLAQACHALNHWLNGAEGSLSDILTTFIGRGEGLTPAGDDFLLGVLWGLESVGKPEADVLKAALPALLHRTTDISRAMLEQGCRGHYSVQLLALASGNTRTWPQAVAKVADYGHSSGHDMLAGVLTAAQASGEPGKEALLHIRPLKLL